MANWRTASGSPIKPKRADNCSTTGRIASGAVAAVTVSACSNPRAPAMVSRNCSVHTANASTNFVSSTDRRAGRGTRIPDRMTTTPRNPARTRSVPVARTKPSTSRRIVFIVDRSRHVMAQLLHRHIHASLINRVTHWSLDTPAQHSRDHERRRFHWKQFAAHRNPLPRGCC